jgi:hypothetical protein
MNIDQARTEALARFQDFSKDFQRSYKVILAALAHIRDIASSPAGDELLHRLLVKARESWKDYIPDADVTVDGALQSSLRLSIVQIYSAADAFVTDLEADRSRWGNLKSLSSTSSLSENGDNVDRLEQVCLRFGWDLGPSWGLSWDSSDSCETASHIEHHLPHLLLPNVRLTNKRLQQWKDWRNHRSSVPYLAFRLWKQRP